MFANSYIYIYIYVYICIYESHVFKDEIFELKSSYRALLSNDVILENPLLYAYPLLCKRTKSYHLESFFSLEWTAFAYRKLPSAFYKKKAKLQATKNNFK